jgi:DNA-binding MarR family transcriptional regulator
MSAKKKKSKMPKARKGDQAEAFSMITQVARNARTALSRHLLDLGLYAGQDGVMLALDARDGQTPGAIAMSLGVKAPTVTKTIGRLAAQGFVRREGSPDDGRMMLVFLTEAGRDQIKSIRKSQRKTEKAVFAGLKQRDITQLLGLLATMDANIARTLSAEAVMADLESDVEIEETPDQAVAVDDEIGERQTD